MEKSSKKSKKKSTSDTINNTIPYRNPNTTRRVWKPRKVPSRITSRHHWNIVNKITLPPNINPPNSEQWNQATKPTAKVIPPIPPLIGQGLGETKWYGPLTWAKFLTSQQYSNDGHHTTFPE